MNKVSSSIAESLKVYASAKINLHLEVLGLRKDGFHELAMVMQSIDLVDEIEITKTNDELISLNSDNPELDNGDGNLIIKAAKLIRSRSGLRDLGALIYLRKKIPIGAGLAGGSSDGAATLVGLNSLWGLNFSNNQLEDMAAELGSDVPFCISGGAQLCFGRGECLEPLDKSDPTLAIVLVKDPSVSVSTPWAYSRYKQLNESTYLSKEIDFQEKRMALRKASWLRPLNASNPPPLINDLQEVVAPATPAVEKALQFLRSLKGVLSVAMSGSGPSCFAIFSDLDQARIALEENQEELRKQCLEGWCCALNSKGVRFAK